MKTEKKTAKPEKIKTYGTFGSLTRAKDDKHLPRGTKAHVVAGNVVVAGPDGVALFSQPAEEFAADRLKGAGFKLA
jgi:hypothetical protein